MPFPVVLARGSADWTGCCWRGIWRDCCRRGQLITKRESINLEGIRALYNYNTERRYFFLLSILELNRKYCETKNLTLSHLSRRLMQARDREPLRCIQNSSPVHASSMPELPQTLAQQPSTTTCNNASLPTRTTAPSTSVTTNSSPVESHPATDPLTPTSRRVRFQGDEAAGATVTDSSSLIQEQSPSTSQPPCTQERRSKHHHHDQLPTTSWGEYTFVFILFLKV